jgi:hypothetical protein
MVKAIIGAVLGFCIGSAATFVLLLSTASVPIQGDVLDFFEVLVVAGCPFAALGGILAAASTILKAIRHGEVGTRHSRFLLARPIAGALAAFFGEV